MTDTFSYNPPVAHQAFPNDYRLGEPHMFSQRQQGAYPTTQTQHNGTNGYDLDQQVVGGTLLRRGGGGSASQESNGSETPVAGGAESQEQYSKGGPSAPILSPTFPTSYQSPYNSYSQQSIVNMRNTRPMTAPSSVSAPYFHGGLYASATSTTPTSSASFYPVHLQQHQPFQYSVDGGENGGVDTSRGRGFSLPELAGVATGSSNGNGVSNRLSGDLRYVDQRRASVGGMPNGGNGVRPATTEGSPGSTFLYGPPPPVVEEQYYLQDGSSPEELSRPTTGESYHNPSIEASRAPHSTDLHHLSANAYQTTNHSPYPSDNIGRFPKSDDPFAYLTKATLQQNNSTSKRPRRRFDEIERLYTCDYPGCLKAYGTLNHLNSHKTMQKHGPKSTPARKSLASIWIVIISGPGHFF